MIRNPEIQKLVPSLLAAIAEPDKHAKKALDQMLGTTFVNTVSSKILHHTPFLRVLALKVDH